MPQPAYHAPVLALESVMLRGWSVPLTEEECEAGILTRPMFPMVRGPALGVPAPKLRDGSADSQVRSRTR